MRIDVENLKGFPVGWGMAAAAKPCDSCKSSAALLFCRADSAFLCMGCDSKIHGANKLASRHERVGMCEVCEQAPAAVTCKADAAALCVNCDADIHSANPLARRHDRVPVEPFYDSAESIVKSSSSSSSAAAAASAANNTAIAAVNFLVPTKIDEEDDDGHDLNCLRHEEAEVASWILPNPPSNPKLATGEMFYSDFDHLLEFDYANSIDLNFKKQQQQQQHGNHGSDSVVPVQLNKTPSSAPQAHHHPLVETCFDIDFSKSKLTAFNYTTAPSLSHSFSSSSLDVGVVPDGSVMSDISFVKKINNNTSTIGVDVGGGILLPTQPSIGLDREARVLRYREKRKNRKFEKTIRYASRKAYAETRPRIKGRFAKRTCNEIETENENEANHMFNMNSNDDHHHNFMVDNGYGVVPSF